MLCQQCWADAVGVPWAEPCGSPVQKGRRVSISMGERGIYLNYLVRLAGIILELLYRLRYNLYRVYQGPRREL